MNRTDLKRKLLNERGDTCDYCGKAGATDMHLLSAVRHLATVKYSMLGIAHYCIMNHVTCNSGRPNN